MILCYEFLGWDSDYQNWSVGDNTSSPWKKNKDTHVGSSDVVADCPDVWNEVRSF